MSEYTSESPPPPPRIRISPTMEGHPSLIHGHPPPRLIVSPGSEAEAQHHSMLLAQLTGAENMHRQAGALSPSSIMFSVGGMAMLNQQHSAFTMARAALGGAGIHPQALLHHASGVPILRGSGLVSLTPGSVPPAGPQRASPPQTRLQFPSDAVPTTVATSHGPVVMLRVPSPSRSPHSSRSVGNTPSPKPHRVMSVSPRSSAASPASSSRSLSPSGLRVHQSPHGHRSSPVTTPYSHLSPHSMHRVSHNSRTLPNAGQCVSPVPSNRIQPSSSIQRLPNDASYGSLPFGGHRRSPSPAHQSNLNIMHRSPQNTKSTMHRASPNATLASQDTIHRASPNAPFGPSQMINRSDPNLIHMDRVSPNMLHRFSPHNSSAHGGPVMTQKPSHGGPVMAQKPSHGGPVMAQKPSHGGPVMTQKPSHGGPVMSHKPPHGGPVMTQKPPHGGPIMTQKPPHGGPVMTQKPSHFPVHRTSPVPGNRYSPASGAIHRLPHTNINRASPHVQHQAASNAQERGAAKDPRQEAINMQHRQSPKNKDSSRGHHIDPAAVQTKYFSRVQHGDMSSTHHKDLTNMQYRELPNVHHREYSSGQSGELPVQNRNSYIHHRMAAPSSVMHRASPGSNQAANLCNPNRASPGKQPRLPVHPSNHGQIKNPPDPNSTSVISTYKTIPSVGPMGQEIPPKHLNDKVNPFVAAMTAMNVAQSKTGSPQKNVPSAPAALLNLLTQSQPPGPGLRLIQTIKQEQEVALKSGPNKQEVYLEKVEEDCGNIAARIAHEKTPVSVSLSQEQFQAPQPVLHRNLTVPVTQSSSKELTKDDSSKPPSLMPFLSSVMGLLPKSGSDLTAIAHPRDLNFLESKLAPDVMPRLMPEVSSFPSFFINGNNNTILPVSKIKEEEEEDESDQKLAPLENPFSQRIKNLQNFPTPGNPYKTTYRSQTMAIHRAKTGCILNTARSLDILRSNLQKFINKEIDELIQKYIEQYFKPGIDNIRLNNGDNSVSDEHMAAVCRQILEEAKRMYMSSSRCNTPDVTDNVSESGSVAPPENKEIREKKLSAFNIRKRRGSSDSEASLTKKRKKGRPPLKTGSGRSTPLKQGKNEPVRRQGAKWDPERLKSDLQFVMGARANKALGLGAQRGRLYIKHPGVFKYCGDQEDKNWLHENHHMPATGGKAYLLIVEDIMELIRSDEYKNNPGLMVGEVIGFTVPDWMLEKMKVQMKALRTDLPKHSKVKPPPLNDFEGTIPFGGNMTPSVGDNKSDMQPSPSTTENQDLISTEQEDEDPPSVSPLAMTGGFTEIGQTPDGSPAPSEMEANDDPDDPPLTAPFEMS